MMRLALIAIAWVALGCAAQALDRDDRQSVEITVNDFLADFESRDWEAFNLPPGLLAHIADLQNSTPERLQAAMIAQTRDMMRTVVVDSVEVDWDAMVTGETDSGTGYAFLPFRSRFRLESGRFHEAVSVNIVTWVDEDWYVVRIGQPQLWALFQAAYPEFGGVDFPG